MVGMVLLWMFLSMNWKQIYFSYGSFSSFQMKLCSESVDEEKKNSVQIDIIIFLLINYDSIICGCVKRLLIDMKWVMWTMKADWTTTRHSVKCTHRFPCVPSTNSIPSIIELIKLNEHMPFSPGPLSMITFLFFPLYVFAQIDW